MIEAGDALSSLGLSGAAPACEKPLQIRETARVAALFDIVEQVSSAAIAVSPGLAKKRLENIRVTSARRGPASVGWRVESQPFSDAAPA